MHIEGASLAAEPPKHGLRNRFERARAFQNRTVEWFHEGDEPVAVVRAPTGAGKTATFLEIIENRELTLLVYPTNALLQQQKKRFEEAGVVPRVLSGDTLSGHGSDRVDHLLQFVNRYAGHDAIITNPDILQAVIQDLYQGSKAMEFFDGFDAVVYDEFHFYDDLAASGLLLQMKIISQRLPHAKLLLASATPNESFVEFVANRLNLETREIEATYVDDSEPFRHPVELHRRGESTIWDNREELCENLETEVRRYDESVEPHIVLVFNSAKRSNDFHDYLAVEHPNLFAVSVKDNGYDTHDPEVNVEDEEFLILNTTSKGEVGLDYDIRLLFMETPRHASDFLQRFGRAGRQHDATVHTFGLGQVSWPETSSFPDFVTSVYEALDNSQMDLDALTDLIGLRAAHAIHTREQDDWDWFNKELYDDFTDVSTYGKWKPFIDSVVEELASAGGIVSPIGKTERKLLTFTQACFSAFRGLRGQSLPCEIQYPRGDRSALTSYDLLSTLHHYSIERIVNNGSPRLIVGQPDDDRPTPITVRLPGYESRPRKYDGPYWEIERQLQDWVHDEIDRVKIGDKSSISDGLLHQFFTVIDITQAVTPAMIRCGRYQIDVETGGGPPTINAFERDL